jgi:hypothetical protein
MRSALCLGSAIVVLFHAAWAQTATPVHGHYPPGQTGLRGAAAPEPGWSITDFNRLFSNLDTKDLSGNTIAHPSEARYANIVMVGWTSDDTFLGMSYGALVGVPFATGNLNPSADEVADSQIALGDIIVTPVSLSGKASDFDYQLQLSVWTPSGEFKAGGLSNRGSGFWSMIYSAGGVWYPGGDRRDWSISAIARLEQNFTQEGTGVTPGNNLDLDWGVGKVIHLASYKFDAGVSGFGTWQMSTQSGGDSIGRYRYYGAGPEISAVIGEGWAARIRAQWEFGTHNAIQGNNIWVILNYQP